MSGPSDTQPQPQAAPAFDTNAMVKTVTDAAVEAATRIAEERSNAAAQQNAQRLNQAAAILTGQPQVDIGEQVLKGLVADPIKFAKTISDATEARVMKTVKAQKATEDLQRSVMLPLIEEYPALKGAAKIALVEKLTEQKEAANIPYAEALKEAAQEVIKEFDLKPVSEAQRTNAALYAGLPGGGGMGSGVAVRDETKSQQDFLSGMRSRMSSFRTKK